MITAIFRGFFNKTKTAHSLLRRELNYYRNRMPLYSAHLEMTYSCNLNCLMCGIIKKKQLGQEELTLKEWMRVLEDLLGLGVRYINFIGAEPLLRKGPVFEMAAYLKNKNIFTTLNTNGTLIDAETAEKIIKLFDKVIISVDAPGEKHDKIRGQSGAFESLSRGISLMSEAKKNHDTSGAEISVQATIFNMNYDLILDMVKMAEASGVDSISFQYSSQVPEEAVRKTMFDGNVIGNERFVSESGSLLLNHKEIALLKDQLRCISKNIHNITIIIKPISLFKDETFLSGKFPIHRCYVTRERAIISPYGGIDVCPQLNYTIGNIKKYPIAKIWGNDRHLRLVRRLAKKLFPICNYCCNFNFNLTPLQKLCLSKGWFLK